MVTYFSAFMDDAVTVISSPSILLKLILGPAVDLSSSRRATTRQVVLQLLKTRLLPILIPARGVNGEVWIADAMQVFAEAGVNLANPIDGPLLPAPAGESGAFLGRSLMSSEVSAMLRSFLGVPNNGHDDNAPLFSSHSLKATTLAWAARYGLSPATSRCWVVIHHV